MVPADIIGRSWKKTALTLTCPCGVQGKVWIDVTIGDDHGWIVAWESPRAAHRLSTAELISPRIECPHRTTMASS